MLNTIFTLTAAGLLCMSVGLSAQTTPKSDSSPGVMQPVAPPLDYATLRKLTCGQSTEAEVRVSLGQPASIDVGDRVEWTYHAGQRHARVQFDAEKRVVLYQYQSYESSPAATLAASQVRQLRTGHAEADMLRLFGPPTYLIASTNSVDIGYSNQPKHAVLQVNLKENPNLPVTDFLFSEDGERSAAIDADKLTAIEKGKTTLADIASQFGVPTQKAISKYQERWMYDTTTARLYLNFNREQANTVMAYQYKTK